ncbi:unnamed protein product [Rhizophagus irregularis]|nr:unnamed protein product [Rhizophagus irregularis]
MAAEGALTDDKIMDAVLNADKEEEIVINDDETEFDEINEELRILKGLHKHVKLQLVKNLKQLNLHNFHDYIADNNVV